MNFEQVLTRKRVKGMFMITGEILNFRVEVLGATRPNESGGWEDCGECYRLHGSSKILNASVMSDFIFDQKDMDTYESHIKILN